MFLLSPCFADILELVDHASSRPMFSIPLWRWNHPQVVLSSRGTKSLGLDVLSERLGPWRGYGVAIQTNNLQIENWMSLFLKSPSASCHWEFPVTMFRFASGGSTLLLSSSSSSPALSSAPCSSCLLPDHTPEPHFLHSGWPISSIFPKQSF